MKNIRKIRLIISSFLILFMSCHFSSSDALSDEINFENVIAKYKIIGENHNKYLMDTYTRLLHALEEKQKAINPTKTSSIYLTTDEISDLIATKKTGVVAPYKAENIVSSKLSERGQIALAKVKTLMENAIETRKSIEEVISLIELEEKRAVKTLPKTDFDEFFSYTATAKNSMIYWKENMSKWDDLKGIVIDRGWWDWLVRPIIAALSDVAGAATGATIGGGLGAVIGVVSIPGVGLASGAIAGSIIGAIVVGAQSSSEAWNRVSFCIFVDNGAILDRAKQWS